MFAHKEISHKVRGLTRTENARHLLEWVYREWCVHILYAFLAYYTQCLCWFCTAKASFHLPLHHATCSWLKTSPIRQSQRLRRRDLDLTAICDRTKKKIQAGISTRAFPLGSRSNYSPHTKIHKPHSHVNLSDNFSHVAVCFRNDFSLLSHVSRSFQRKNK